MAKFEILLLGDSSHLFRTIAWVLEYKGYAVKAAASPEAAIEALVKKNYDLVITKLSANEHDGLDVLKRARKLNPRVKVMVIAGAHDLVLPLEAYQIAIDDYILMPVSPAELWRRVNGCLESLEIVDLKPSRPAAQAATPVNERVWNRLMIMLHDIRGSMVSTDAALKLVMRGKQGDLGAQAKTRLQDVSGRIKSLIHLTEEFMSQVAADETPAEIPQEVIDLRRDIVEPVLSELSGEIRDQGITLENHLNFDAAPAIPVRGSRLWLQSIFRNLLNNGIRHGGSGCTIVIDWETAGGSCRLNVHNSGGPIPERRRSMLFSNRVPKMRQASGDGQGLGVGLYLSRKLAHSQGGDICYEATQNGSNFVLSMPQG
jgi:signal transduction histidine kinase